MAAKRRDVRYLAVDEVIGIHTALMERFGQAAHLVRPDNLESAVLRPRTAAHYGGASLLDQAASLGLGVSQAQAFLDGNKRAGFAAMDVFLRLNGILFVGDSQEAAQLFTDLGAAIAGRATSMDEAIAVLAGWLRARCQPTTGS